MVQWSFQRFTFCEIVQRSQSNSGASSAGSLPASRAATMAAHWGEVKSLRTLPGVRPFALNPEPLAITGILK